MFRSGSYPDLLKSETFLKRYDRIFAELGDQPIIAELGVHAGDSLRLWKDLFPRGTILGFDRLPPSKPLAPGVVFIQGAQDSPADLRKLIEHAGAFDVVIDDCSHLARPTRIAFETLFPSVRPGGFYIIEDWGTGYWPQWPDGGLFRGKNHLAGLVGFVKELVDGVGIPAINRLRTPPPLHEANWSTRNSPYEFVTFFPGMVAVKRAGPAGEPMHSPCDRLEPSAGERVIDVPAGALPNVIRTIRNKLRWRQGRR
jgi:hypothetical protein